MFMILNSMSSKSATGGFSPSDISNLKVWYDATDVLSGAEPSADAPIGGAGALWQDKSGNGWNLSQSTGTRQPLYKTNIINGLPGIKLDGTDDYLLNTSVVVSQPNTWIYVISGGLANDKFLMDGDRITDRQVITCYFVNNNWMIFAGTVSDQTINATTTNATVLVATFNGSASIIKANASEDTGLAAGSGSLDGLIIGARYSITQFGNSYLHEILCYENLSAENQTTVENYLKTKWGITY